MKTMSCIMFCFHDAATFEHDYIPFIENTNNNSSHDQYLEGMPMEEFRGKY